MKWFAVFLIVSAGVAVLNAKPDEYISRNKRRIQRVFVPQSEYEVETDYDPDVKKCPQPGFEYMDELDNCFWLSNYKTQWLDAACACASKESVLVTVDTLKKHNTLVDILVDNEIDTLWIGLSDIAKEGTYAWKDSTPLIFTRFNRNQPDNYKDGEDCIEISRHQSFKWNDRPCDDTKRFICEAVKSSESNPKSKLRSKNLIKENCPKGWIQSSYSNACYHSGSFIMNYSEAEDYCKEVGGVLTSITNANENNFLKGFLDESHWIGLSDRDVEGRYAWLDGKKYTFHNFNKNQPDNYQDNEDCIEMKKNAFFRWNDIPCDENRRPLCKLVKTSK